MEQGNLIDTNTLIYFLNAQLPEKGHLILQEVFEKGASVSFISQIELLCFPSITDEQTGKILQLLSLVTIYNVDALIIEKTIAIRKASKLKLPDALIAAIALTNHCRIITRNSKDFSKVPDLIVLNPFEIEA